MGNDTSAAAPLEKGFDSSGSSNSNKTNKLSKHKLAENQEKVTTRKMVTRWKKRILRKQLCAVVRHGERADSVFGESGCGWIGTQDFQDFPVDPPLSQHGLVQARQVGEYLAGLAAEDGETFHVVVSSPYKRCVQTAVEICKTLGDHVPLLLDNELGEIYGPSIMGENRPQRTIRPWQHTQSYCAQNGVNLRPNAVGHHPIWPETVGAARERFVQRYLKYLHRGLTARRNFIIVTHGDQVATGLSVMPAQADTAVEKVDYCGCFLARRQRKDDSLEALVQSSDSDQRPLPGSEEFDFDQHADSEREIEVPEGWLVETKGLEVQHMPRRNILKRFGQRVKRLSQPSHYTWNQVQQLLGYMPETPLSLANGEHTPHMSWMKDDDLMRSSASLSTCLFGASQVSFGNILSNPSPLPSLLSSGPIIRNFSREASRLNCENSKCSSPKPACNSNASKVPDPSVSATASKNHFEDVQSNTSARNVHNAHHQPTDDSNSSHSAPAGIPEKKVPIAPLIQQSSSKLLQRRLGSPNISTVSPAAIDPASDPPSSSL